MNVAAPARMPPFGRIVCDAGTTLTQGLAIA
jgi:hypothetical protein